MKKYYLSSIFVVATLMLAACQSPIKVEEIVNEIEQDSPVEVEKSTSRLVRTTYYDKSLFKLPLDHPYWETTVLNKDTIRDMKERYGFIDEEVTVENENSEEESKVVSSEKNNGSEKEELTENKTESTSKPTQNVSTSINTSNSATNNSSSVSKPNNNNQSSSSTNQPTTPPVVEEKPQPQPPVQPSEPAPQPTPPVVEQPSEPTPQPTPPVVEETKKPVDILDWNYIRSTLIAKGESLGMIHESSMNRELDGWESPWQSSYMPVTNEDVIGYIGTKMERISSQGWTHFNLEWVPQGDGNVNIYLIR